MRRMKTCQSNCPKTVRTSADVKQRAEQLGVDALSRKGIALRQNRDRIMTVQAFLVAGHNAKITHPRFGLQLLAEQPRR